MKSRLFLHVLMCHTSGTDSDPTVYTSPYPVPIPCIWVLEAISLTLDPVQS